jgi:hypothetical protein
MPRKVGQGYVLFYRHNSPAAPLAPPFRTPMHLRRRRGVDRFRLDRNRYPCGSLRNLSPEGGQLGREGKRTGRRLIRCAPLGGAEVGQVGHQLDIRILY